MLHLQQKEVCMEDSVNDTCVLVWVCGDFVSARWVASHISIQIGVCPIRFEYVKLWSCVLLYKDTRAGIACTLLCIYRLSGYHLLHQGRKVREVLWRLQHPAHHIRRCARILARLVSELKGSAVDKLDSWVLLEPYSFALTSIASRPSLSKTQELWRNTTDGQISTFASFLPPSEASVLFWQL